MGRVTAVVAVAGLAMAASGTFAGPATPRSIQDVMIEVIDPAADALWGSVGVIETANGAVQRAPRTSAEWARAHRHALTLVAGARSLGRARLEIGGKTHGRLADADTPGTRKPRQIRADIDRDPARFAAAADRLRRGGDLALTAIAARDAGRLTAAGAAIDAACEACHAAYWYPRDRLALPPPGQFGRLALRP